MNRGVDKSHTPTVSVPDDASWAFGLYRHLLPTGVTTNIHTGMTINGATGGD
jgi:hypothetical protein